MIAYDIDITPSPSAGTHVLGYLFNALSHGHWMRVIEYMTTDSGKHSWLGWTLHMVGL
jgi:hypothetical protein